MEELIREWGYIILFLYSFGGGFVALAAAGVLSYTGELDLTTSIIVAGSANFIGDQFLFILARRNKEYAKNIMGKYHNLISKTEGMMIKFGSFAIILQKYIYGVKTLIPLIIGLTTYDIKKFIVFNILGSIAWAVVVGTVSFQLGEVVLSFGEDFKYIGLGFVVLVFAGLTYYMKKNVN